MTYVDNIQVFRIISSTKTFIEVLTNPIDVTIEKDIKDDDKTLSFSIQNKFKVKEEDYLRCFDQEWVVKEVNAAGEFKEIICKHNIEKMKHTPVTSMYTDSLTLVQTLDAFFGQIDTLDYGGNWSYELHSSITSDSELMNRNRTIDLRRVMAINVIESIASTWFLEVEYDTFNKIVRFYKQRGEDKGVYFTSQFNLKDIESNSDTYELVTRLIPIGKDDLNVASVNGGSVVVSNFQYTDKVLTKYWIDNRYTHADHLLADAIMKLEELSKPLKTYSCSIIDLSSTTHPALSYDLGDTVTIIDEELGIRDVQRINKITIHPYDPETNTAELANRRETFDEIQSKLVDTRDVVNNTYSSSGKIIFNEVDGLPTFKQTVEEDIDALSITVQTIEETINEIESSAYVVTLGNESQGIPVDENYKIVGDVDFGTAVYVYLGGDRRVANLGPIKFYSADGNELTSLTVDYNENNIYNSDFSDDLLPNFGGESETVNGNVTIDGNSGVLASTTALASEFIVGNDNSTSTYFSDPELPFVAGQPITFSGYLTTYARTHKTAWVVSTAYVIDDEVYYDGQNYKCIVDHTSVDFYNDLDAQYWEKIGYAHIAIYEWVGGVKNIYQSASLGMSEEGLVVVSHTISDGVTNIALAVISSDGDVAHTLRFKELKLEEGFTSTTYTPLLDIKNNFEVVNPSDTHDGSVMTTLIEGTYLPSNVGYLSIPVEVDGTIFYKRIVFTRIVTSENAVFINILPTTVIFQSSDGGASFEPSSIRLYPDLRNLEYVKWQYSYDGYNFYDIPYDMGTLIETDAPWDLLDDILISPAPADDPDPFEWEDLDHDPGAAVLEESDGFADTLLLFSNSTLFTKVVGGQSYPVNSVVFRLVGRADNVDYTDTVTISKVYDSRDSIKSLESVVRTDIESINESVREFRNDLYYFNEDSGRYELYTRDYTQFKQDVNNFMFTVQDGGGANLLKDSVGANYPASNVWTLVSGAVSTGVATSWGLNYISKKSWFISTGSLKQEFTIQPNTEYTFSCAYRKPVSGTVTFSLKASTWTNPQTMITKPAGEAFEGSASFTFMSGANTRFEVIMTVNGATEPVEITDVMMSLGKISSWQQSNGELFTTNIIIDETGITVRDANGKGYTVISPQEFAGYYDGQRIFTLNGSKTEVQELVAKGGGIYVAPVKLIQVSGATPRAAFVWTGPEGE